MTISSLSLLDFRCFEEAEIEPDPNGLTVLHGENGSGKTSVLEAIGWLATLRSIRGATRETVIRRGTGRAILRAETKISERSSLLEVEVRFERQGRAQLNRQAVRRRVDLAQALQVSVFSPADRRLVEGGPSERREYLDEVLTERHPRLEALVDEVGQILRQRGALLRQVGGRIGDAVASTLDVWDARLAASGEELAGARERLVAELEPLVADAYSQIAGSEQRVELSYVRSWQGELSLALGRARSEDLRRQVTTVGPHRDELEIRLGPSPARTHASQGEQRCIALALRLGTHELRTAAALEPPVLLLDDVFSELDPVRSSALVKQLPPGQVLLTTAVDPPAMVNADRVVEVSDGRLLASQARR